MTTQYDVPQLKVVEEYLALLATNSMEIEEETLKKLLPYYVKKIDDKSFLFMNKYDEVIVHYKDTFCIEINQWKDSKYYKRLEIFKCYSVEGFLKKDEFFYDEHCLIWRNKKYLNKYIKKLSNFIKSI